MVSTTPLATVAGDAPVEEGLGEGGLVGLVVAVLAIAIHVDHDVAGPPGAEREGELRDLLHTEITRWRAALRRTVIQAVEAQHLKTDTDPEQLVGEIYSLAIGLIHDARFLRDPRAAERAQASWDRLIRSYQP